MGRYTVTRKLAAGGMAEVYLGVQKGPGTFKRDIVLKRIHPHLAQNEEFFEMFLNEATLAATLSHPSIVHVYDLVETQNGDHFIAMEYVRGCTVHRLLRRLRKKSARLPVPFALHIALRVCEALDYAYNSIGSDGSAQRIIHRDVSPSNVLVGTDGQVKLFDFGVAKALHVDAVTRVGSVKGKLTYMSPEQVTNQSLDNRSDLFALGAVLYELLTGERMFKRENDAAVIHAILNEEPPSVTSMVDDVPKELDEIIARAVAKDRDDRYDTIGAMAMELEEIAAQYEWSMRSSTLGAFVQSWFSDDELGMPGGTDIGPPSFSYSGASFGGSGTRSRSASSSRPGVSERPSVVSQRSVAPPSPPSLPTQPSASPSQAPPSEEIDRVSVAIVVAFFIASALFWFVGVPSVG